MDQDQSETPLKLGVKIEPPPSEEQVGPFFIFLAILSLILISFTTWLLILEWIGKPLPSFLKLPIA